MITLFQYRCLPEVVIRKAFRQPDASEFIVLRRKIIMYQEEFDYKNREVVILNKMLVTDKMLPHVQDAEDALSVWTRVWEMMHETSDKGQIKVGHFTTNIDPS